MKETTTPWVKELLNNMDRYADSATVAAILEACGARCPFSHLPDEKVLAMKVGSDDETAFLDKLAKQWRLTIENGRYYVVFDQCYCPLVRKDQEGASKSLCHCTVGNIRHKFQIGLGREVGVEMQKTILAGDDECRFLVKIQGD